MAVFRMGRADCSAKQMRGAEDKAVIYFLSKNCETVNIHSVKQTEQTLGNHRTDNSDEGLAKLLPCNFR